MSSSREIIGIRLIPTAILLTLLLTLPASRAYTLQPPSLSSEYEGRSAGTYMSLEREFVKNYLFDTTYGGTYLSVDGRGNVLNSTKDIIFQTNVILFLAGMDSQGSDPDLVRFVDSAASFVVNHLAWGPDGSGTWDAWSNRNGSIPHRMDWLSHSEAYISYGLLWAYRITGNNTYLAFARTNLNYQMVGFPDGHILFSPGGGPNASDLTQRSPERMTYYTMWKLTGNASYLNYAQKVQTAETTMNGWSPNTSSNATVITAGPHADSILDEALFALVAGGQTALQEGRQLFAGYESDGHNSRDDLQNFITLDFAYWTMTHDPTFRDDAIRVYSQLLQLWDPSPPYGFWADTGKTTKTCFTRGYPLLDMTPPVISADPAGQKITATITDPAFTWLDMTLNGIGVNPASVYLFYSLDGKQWSNNIQMTQTGNGTFATTVPQNVASQNPQYFISASDYFNNTSTVQFAKAFVPQQTAVNQPTVQETITPTLPPTTPVSASSGGVGFAVLLLGIGIPLMVVAALIFLRRPLSAPRAIPPIPQGPERNLYCRCPYWVECARVHSQCPMCTKLREMGGCCACYIMSTNYCNHSPGLGPVYGPHVNYGPNPSAHRTSETQQKL